MVHQHRYHNLKKGLQVEDIEENEETPQTFYKKTRPKLFPFLLLFFLASSSLFFMPRFLTYYSFGIESDATVVSDASICSSMSHGSICCDRNSIRSDICYMKGDVRTESASFSVTLYVSNNTQDGFVQYPWTSLEEEREDLIREKIKPYTRKWETSVMDTIDELDLVVRKKFGSGDSTIQRPCDVQHSVPAVFFSTGGYTGNVYHEFNDGILPLYITSQRFNREVVFVMLEYHEWWITKYGDILSRLSKYPPIDFSNDKRTHCFPEAIVGLNIHDELTIDSSLIEGNKSVRDFRSLLDKAYSPRINGLIRDEEVEAKGSSPPSPSLDIEEEIEIREPEKKVKKPKLVILSRNGSRSITNENSLVELAEEVGFEVEVLRPNPTTELAKIYMVLNSSDTMLGVHGAAMTHFLFMRPGTVFIQVVPLGTDWAAQTYYGDPSIKLGLKYVGYKILPRESSLYTKYNKDDPVLRDPDSVNAKGWEFTKKVYLDGQNVRLNLGRMRKRLVRAYEYSISRRNGGEN